jgi:hypothetical protein
VRDPWGARAYVELAPEDDESQPRPLRIAGPGGGDDEVVVTSRAYGSRTARIVTLDDGSIAYTADVDGSWALFRATLP